jgi:hypothetical protein
MCFLSSFASIITNGSEKRIAAYLTVLSDLENDK